jgi:uncharacterized protein
MDANLFTDEEKIAFDSCNTFEEFTNFLDSFDVNKFDNYGNTILHYYLKSLMHKSNLENYKITKPYWLSSELIIREIVKKGIDINSHSTKGALMHTPLNLAILLRSKEIFDLLIELGANVNIKIGNGTVLFTAIMNYDGIDGYFIEKLINSGADINIKNDYGISPFTLAKGISNKDVGKYFP